MSTPSSRGQSIHFDPLEGGIIGDEHRMRRAHIRHREVELEGKRVDARITSLESLATQATLIAGFSYSSIRPDDGAGLLDAHKFTAFVVFVSACATVVAFCSALWVVYLTGYASIRARIAFLQGSRRQAVEHALEVLETTQGHARTYFDLSMGSLVLSAITVVLQHPSLYSLPLLILFSIFILNGAFHKRQIDTKLQRWTQGVDADSPCSESFASSIDRLHEQLLYLQDFLFDQFQKCTDSSGAYKLPCFADEEAGQMPYGDLESPQRRQLSDKTCRIQLPEQSSASGVGAGEERQTSCRPIPPLLKPQRSSFSLINQPSFFRGWAYKSSGKPGPLRRPPPQQISNRRFLVYSSNNNDGDGNGGPQHVLRVFVNQEHSELHPAKQPKRQIELSRYTLVCWPEDEDALRLGLQPFVQSGRGRNGKGTPRREPSWWIKCLDANSFHQLGNLLRSVCASVDLGEEEEEEAESGMDTARSEEEEEEAAAPPPPPVNVRAAPAAPPVVGQFWDASSGQFVSQSQLPQARLPPPPVPRLQLARADTERVGIRIAAAARRQAELDEPPRAHTAR